MLKSVSSHNNNIYESSKNTVNDKSTCNCRNKEYCPLRGKCLSKHVVCRTVILSGNEEKMHWCWEWGERDITITGQ